MPSLQFYHFEQFCLQGYAFDSKYELPSMQFVQAYEPLHCLHVFSQISRNITAGKLLGSNTISPHKDEAISVIVLYEGTTSELVFLPTVWCILPFKKTWLLRFQVSGMN